MTLQGTMRKAVITDLDGRVLGSIEEVQGGTVNGDGKGESLVRQAPGKSFDDWMETTKHSKYLRFVDEDDASATPSP